MPTFDSQLGKPYELTEEQYGKCLLLGIKIRESIQPGEPGLFAISEDYGILARSAWEGKYLFPTVEEIIDLVARGALTGFK